MPRPGDAVDVAKRKCGKVGETDKPLTHVRTTSMSC